MRVENHNLLLVRLMFKSAETGTPLLVNALKREKGEVTKRFIVEVICKPELLRIRDSGWSYPMGVHSETARFVNETLMFHDLKPTRDKWTHADKEKYLNSSYDIKVIKRSKSYSGTLTIKNINVKNIELSKTALILFGDSEIVNF